MEGAYCAYLIKVGSKEAKPSRKRINSSEFRIGRSKEANLCLTDVSVSRNHCIIMYSNDEWTLKNESQLGTVVNGTKIAVSETCKLINGDLIQLGPQSEFTYKFCVLPKQDEPLPKRAKMEASNSEPSSQNTEPLSCSSSVQNLDQEEDLLKKQNEDLNAQLEKIAQEKEEFRLKYEDEKKRIEIELLSEKNALEQKLLDMENLLRSKEKEQEDLCEKLKQTDEENKKQEKNALEQKLLEMENLLRSKEKEQEELCEKLKQTNEENKKQEKNALEQKLLEMENLLRSKEKEQEELCEKLKQTDEENKKLEMLRQEQALAAEKTISALRNEVLTKELTMREMLDMEMQKLLDSRQQIEENIKFEKAQTEGACAEKVKSLEDELYRVKCDLINAIGKRSLLEKELEESEKAKQKETESSLIAKREALSEFSNLIEMELQCSICNELFVKAMTLNCTHTVCHHCLHEWKKKKNNCPMCRAPILTENHSIVLDNFIDKIVENLSDELKTRRLEMIEERKALEILAVQPSKNKGKKRKGRPPPASPAEVLIVQPTTSAYAAQTPDIIYVGTSETDAYAMQFGPQQNPTNHRYGGYGACFICGQRGHWAGGCPFNTRNNPL